MLDIVFLIAFFGLPVAIWWISRSVVFTTVGLVLGFGLGGNLVQTLIAMGVPWNVRGLQVLVFVVMLVLLALARGMRAPEESLRRQVVAVGVPAVAVGLFLVLLRLLAPEDPGALSAIGYFINHPLAEDNAKWLHLSAQVADGRTIAFNGYAGGPLLLLMAAFSPLISVLSMIFLGGVNQVAVAANTVLAVQFFLIAAVPFALAPFAMWRGRTTRSLSVPLPILWTAALFLALASAVVTSYGHLSQQFTFIVLTLWIAAFLTQAPRWILLATSLSVATSVSVWVPLNFLALVVLVIALIATIRLRWWSGVIATAVTLVVTFDAIVSSALYVLGIEIRLTALGVGAGDAAGAEGGAALEVAASDPGELIASAHLFRAPGATEQTSALLATVAVVVVLASVWFMVRKLDMDSRRAALALAPLSALVGYLIVLTAGDALVTGASPNYGTLKMAFTVVVVATAAGIPFGLLAIDADASGMSVLRWAGAAAVVVILLVDSLLPRAVSALTPLLWTGIDSSAPVYWSGAEVNGTGSQPLADSPIACVFTPPDSSQPTALPLGQESYSCTRILIGLSGQEGDANLITQWLLTDWQNQSQNWDTFRDSIEKNVPELLSRPVIVMRKDGGLAGYSTLGELIERNPVGAG